MEDETHFIFEAKIQLHILKGPSIRLHLPAEPDLKVSVKRVVSSTHQTTWYNDMWLQLVLLFRGWLMSLCLIEDIKIQLHYVRSALTTAQLQSGRQWIFCSGFQSNSSWHKCMWEFTMWTEIYALLYFTRQIFLVFLQVFLALVKPLMKFQSGSWLIKLSLNPSL